MASMEQIFCTVTVLLYYMLRILLCYKSILNPFHDRREGGLERDLASLRFGGWGGKFNQHGTVCSDLSSPAAAGFCTAEFSELKNPTRTCHTLKIWENLAKKRPSYGDLKFVTS